jgi:hypothetical protein
MAEPDKSVERIPVDSADEDDRDNARSVRTALATAEPESEPGKPEADEGWTPV